MTAAIFAPVARAAAPRARPSRRRSAVIRRHVQRARAANSAAPKRSVNAISCSCTSWPAGAPRIEFVGGREQEPFEVGRAGRRAVVGGVEQRGALGRRQVAAGQAGRVRAGRDLPARFALGDQHPDHDRRRDRLGCGLASGARRHRTPATITRAAKRGPRAPSRELRERPAAGAMRRSRRRRRRDGDWQLVAASAARSARQRRRAARRLIGDVGPRRRARSARSRSRSALAAAAHGDRHYELWRRLACSQLSSMWAAARESSPARLEPRSLAGDVGGEALVVELDRDALPQAQRQAPREVAGLARLLGVASAAATPAARRRRARPRARGSVLRSPRARGGWRAGRSASIGVTIVPVGSLSAQPQRALP